MPHLDSAVTSLEKRLGIRPVPGGRHEGRGTRNALMGLGDRIYLEILGPDSEALAPDRPRWFGVDRLDVPRLAGWAAAGTELDALVERAVSRGVRLGAVSEGSRRRPDGVLLSWILTDTAASPGDGSSRSASTGATRRTRRSGPGGVTLAGLGPSIGAAENRGMLAAVGVALDVRAAATPAWSPKCPAAGERPAALSRFAPVSDRIRHVSSRASTVREYWPPFQRRSEVVSAFRELVRRHLPSATGRR